jgi:hypothetical protein
MMTIAFSNAARVMMSRGLMSSFNRCRMALRSFDFRSAGFQMLHGS